MQQQAQRFSENAAFDKDIHGRYVIRKHVREAASGKENVAGRTRLMPCLETDVPQ